MDTVCLFRHALALDERRVKFIPEYAYGTQSLPARLLKRPESAATEPTTNGPTANEPTATNPEQTQATPQPPHTKEVWFAGSHSDMYVKE